MSCSLSTESLFVFCCIAIILSDVDPSRELDLHEKCSKRKQVQLDPAISTATQLQDIEMSSSATVSQK